MQIYAKVHAVGEVISGTSDNGNDWEKQTIVFQTQDEKSRFIAIDFMGERKTQTTKKLKVGDLCAVNYVVNSTCYMDKWYTHAEGISITPLQAALPISPTE